MKIGFLGYGEAARAFHEGLAREGISFVAFDIKLDDAATGMREAMLERGAVPSPTIA